MVASLQSRRDALETMLREKTFELKQLCIQEAELTGILPPETPLAPGEQPLFARKIDDHLTGNVENRWFQRGSQISNSVSGLNAYSSIRRIGKQEFQYSQYDLQSSELELNNIFRQVHINKVHTNRPASSGTWNRNQQWYRHSFSQIHHKPNGLEFPNWPKQNPQRRAPSSKTNQCYATLPKDNRLKSQYDSLRVQDLSHNNCTSFGGYAVPPPNSASPQNLAPYERSINSTLPVAATRHRSLSISSPIGLEAHTNPESHFSCNSNNGAKNSSCQSLNLYSIPEKGSHQFHCNSLGRKRREKEWRETSLDTDSSTRQLPSPSLRTPNIPESASFQRLLSRHRMQSRNSSPLQSPPDFSSSSPRHRASKSPMELAMQMESNVPLESPKNHMVVEVGKWKPYRESTKPFEMSDFYKYSTKFKNIKE